MPSPLTTTVNAMVASHVFFTTYLGGIASLKIKRHLGRKLLLYEARGRPVDTSKADLDRFDDEWSLWHPRPQLNQARTQVERTLSTISQSPFVARESILSSASAFPAIFWAVRFSSSSQMAWLRQHIRRFHGQPEPVTISAADRQRYALLRLSANSGYANIDRARLVMKYNAVDLDDSLPRHGLVDTPLF